MALEPVFNSDIIRKAIKEQGERIIQVLIRRLSRIGENFVTNSKNNGTYQDRTGNLRSSVGYVILDQGEQIEIGGFKPIKPTAKLGPILGPDLIEEIKPLYPYGLVFIGVAGMEYAAKVEDRGLDVITGSAQIAEDELRQAIKEIESEL